MVKNELPARSRRQASLGTSRIPTQQRFKSRHLTNGSVLYHTFLQQSAAFGSISLSLHGSSNQLQYMSAVPVALVLSPCIFIGMSSGPVRLQEIDALIPFFFSISIKNSTFGEVLTTGRIELMLGIPVESCFGSRGPTYCLSLPDTQRSESFARVSVGGGRKRSVKT